MAQDSVAHVQLQSFVRRIESVEDEIKALNDDKSEIYKEARGNGFDVKILRKVVAARRMDADERREQGELFELYWDAIHGSVRAHVENVEEFPAHDADGVVLDDEPQPSLAAAAVQMQRHGGGLPLATANGSETSLDRAEGIADGQPIHQEPLPGKSVEALASAAPLAFTPKPLRPHCLKPQACGGQGKQHCWGCTQAMSKAGEVA